MTVYFQFLHHSESPLGLTGLAHAYSHEHAPLIVIMATECAVLNQVLVQHNFWNVQTT